MSNQENPERHELEERILSKQQQIDFEKKNLNFEAQQAWENRENPDVMEESKNFSDPVETTLDRDELSSLRKAEEDLKVLLKQLEDLDQH